MDLNIFHFHQVSLYFLNAMFTFKVKECHQVSSYPVSQRGMRNLIQQIYVLSTNTKFGEIPDEKIRKSVADITGFVVGKQLINMGYTSYDEHGDIVEFAAYTSII